MPKRLYKCEVCGKRKSLSEHGKKQVVCVDCVSRDLTMIDDRVKKIEIEVKNKISDTVAFLNYIKSELDRNPDIMPYLSIDISRKIEFLNGSSQTKSITHKGVKK